MEFNVTLNGVNIGAMASRGHENNLHCGLGLGWGRDAHAEDSAPTVGRGRSPKHRNQACA